VKETPNTGIGIGAAAGFLTGGATAAFVSTSANRVMLVDLGAGLGALGGASLASPLVFKNESETKTRLFLTAVLGGTIIGGTLGWLATREPRPEPQKAAKTRVFPTIGPAATPGLPPTWTAGLAGIF
jgi:peptidoglycan/LPS O-acetylase OafA/YrhL